jgi:tRNA(fMet)-specific endonuclease VapC
MFMLDTDVCIYLIKERPSKLLAEILKRPPSEICLSSVTVSELEYGVAKSAHPERNRRALDKFLLPFEIAPYGMDAARAYGPVRAELERKGRPIGSLDTMIAAHAKSLKATLITNNVKEFSRVAGLEVGEWSK